MASSVLSLCIFGRVSYFNAAWWIAILTQVFLFSFCSQFFLGILYSISTLRVFKAFYLRVRYIRREKESINDWLHQWWCNHFKSSICLLGYAKLIAPLASCLPVRTWLIWIGTSRWLRWKYIHFVYYLYVTCWTLCSWQYFLVT